ncbi:hypothetical protein CK203_036507 [Vitis vinifera]|uniref:DUF659 domain-containing protein n=1 Tax=Vitis vinifera TaxID=29760 RepID=A0A438HZV1_VITVI|nr:hypothetical protein CK203_036507 [Vitis vinifera]
MASEGGSAMPGRDPAWKYCSPIEDYDDEDAEDEDMYMYPTDMHPDERDAYRSAIRASKTSNWEHEQHENIVGSERKLGKSFTSIPSTMRKSQTRQKNIKDIFKGGAINETMGCFISKFFIYESVAPAKAKSHHFKNMIIGAQQVGMGIEPPSPYEIKNKYLEMEYKEMEAYVNQQREKWKTYGCTIMSDGWTGPTKLSIINFMVYSKGTTVFLKLVDASNYIKDYKYIYKLLKTIIKEVGKENVVQIVTDNGSAFMKAGKQLMKKYNLYWTPCAVHCIDLIFEDITKRPSVIECGGDIVRPEATRRGVGSDSELLQVVHDVFAKLDPTTESLDQFGNEPRWVKKKIISCSNGLGLYTWMTKLEILIHKLSLMFENLELMLNMCCSKEVHSESFSKDIDDSFQTTLNSHQEIDSTSAGHSSRPSAAGTFTSGYDGSRGGTDDGGDNGGGDIDERRHSQYPISQFTCENDFTHCTHDEDHDSRRAGPGIGAIGKPYRGKNE